MEFATPEQSENIEIPNQAKEQNVDFARHVSDISEVKLVFYRKLCGWSETNRNELIDLYGEKIENIVNKIKINKYARMMSEDGADYLYGSIELEVNHISTTGKLSAIQIYKYWDMITAYTGYNFLAFYHFYNNPFQFKIELYTDVISFLTGASNFSYKAEGGYTLDKLSSTEITNRLIRSGIPLQPEKRGIGEAIKGIFH